MNDLIEWLGKVLDGDEAVADPDNGVKLGCTPWRWEGGDKIPGTEQSVIVAVRNRIDGSGYRESLALVGTSQAELAIVHLGDPRAALARVASHREILREHKIVDDGESWQHCARCQDHNHHDVMRAPCRTVKLIGEMYAHRAGYLEVWRP